MSQGSVKEMTRDKIKQSVKIGNVNKSILLRHDGGFCQEFLGGLTGIFQDFDGNFLSPI